MLRSSLAAARRSEARRWQGYLRQKKMAHPKRTAKANSPKSTLRPRPAAFVREYVGAGCRNAKQAAIRAGYAGGASAEVTASRLLRNPRIAAEIEKAQGRLLRRHDLSADRVLRAIANMVFFDLGSSSTRRATCFPGAA